jgi:hypothetical protein
VFVRRVATLLALALLAVPSAAYAQPPAPVPHIRLAGAFAMTGRITAARGVAGEHVGETVTRTWTFLASCPIGQCLTEGLVRSRAVGSDQTRLRRKLPVFSRWTGEGSFFIPLMCGSQVYRRGERVFFRITVQITGVVLVDGLRVASTVKASYRSYRRTNRTRCVFPLGSDAAVYTGTLVMPAPPPSPAPAPAPAPPGPTPVPG